MSLRDLSEDIWVRIAQFLPLQDFVQLAVLNKQTFSIFKIPTIWKRKYLDDFGNTELYLSWLNEAGITINPSEISPTFENQERLRQISGRYDAPSSKAHLAQDNFNSVKSMFYNSDMEAYKCRFSIVNHLNTQFNSKIEAKEHNGKVAANVLTLIKQSLKEFSSGSAQGNQNSAAQNFHNIDVLEYINDIVRNVLLVMNEFPWSPECFHLLGFICFFIGKDAIARNFLNIGLSICNSNFSDESMDVNNDKTKEYHSHLVSQFEASLSLSKTPMASIPILEVKYEIISLLSIVEQNIAATMGSSGDLPLLDENETNLHPAVLEKLKTLFAFFDEDKDQVLNFAELGNLVNFTNTDFSVPNGSMFNINYFKRLNLPQPNRSLLLQVINRYEPNGKLSTFTSNRAKQTTGIKKSRYSKSKIVAGFSFNGLVSFYLDQTLQDPMETRKDLSKVDLLLKPANH